MSALTRGQQQFRDRLAQQTGLNPGVITAWLLAEESGSASKSRESQGQHNWLNIGWTDTGRLPLTYGREWSSPTAAADATAAFLKGQKYGASSGIRQILSAAGKSPMQQMDAISRAGWASSGYGGSNTLLSLYNQYGKDAPAVAAAPTSQASGSQDSRPAFRDVFKNSVLQNSKAPGVGMDAFRQALKRVGGV
jgi:hypothetical protein